MKRKQLWIFVVCYFGYTAIYIARLNLSMAAPAMKELGILNPAQLGLLGSVYTTENTRWGGWSTEAWATPASPGR